ncbi:MAG: lipid II flippase MurJ, partial [Casimicrobiaceae bacterium]
VAGAAATMGIVLWLLRGDDQLWLRLEPLVKAAWLLGLTLAGALVYLGMLLALGLRPRQFLRREV